MAKRANGEGTLRRRKDGTYEGRVFLGYNRDTGKPITKSVYAKTKKQVLEKMESVKQNAVQIPTGDNMSAGMSGNTKLSDWMTHWLETYSSHIKPCTHNEYLQEIRLRINPQLGEYRLNGLTLDVIQQAFNQQFNSGAASAKTIANAQAVLHNALTYAVRNGLIKSNPSDGLIRPRKPVDVTGNESMMLLKNAELAAFISATENCVYGDVLRFLLFSGMRKGECFGLTFKQVDLDSNEIHVCQQLYYDKDAHLYRIAEVKNSRPRTIALNKFTRDILLKRQNSRTSHDPDDFVFTTSAGTHLCPTTVHKAFKRVCQSIGKPNLRIHDLRHNFASLSLAAGVDVKMLQDTLGHSSAAFTLRQYAHTNMELSHRAAAKTEDYFEGIMKQK